MTRNEKSNNKSNECPRFRQHNYNKLQKLAGDKQGEKNVENKKQDNARVSAASSNLSRNVITNITPEQSTKVVKRKGAVAGSTSSKSLTSDVSLKITKSRPSNEYDRDKSITAQIFEAGPPPSLNSLHRLNKKVSNVKTDLEVAENTPDKAGLKLAEEKLVESPRSNNNFRKTVSKRVDISPEEQLYSSLANLSLSCTSFDERLQSSPHGFWLATESKKGRDPEPKLEWFHQPYEGTEVICHASENMIQMLADESDKVGRQIFLSTPATSLYNDFDM